VAFKKNTIAVDAVPFQNCDLAVMDIWLEFSTREDRLCEGIARMEWVGRGTCRDNSLQRSS